MVVLTHFLVSVIRHPLKLHQDLLTDVALDVVALKLDLVGAGFRQVR